MVESTPEERRTLFRIVRGDPSAAELAALTVVLAAVHGAPPVAGSPTGAWNDPATRLRAPLATGPDAWRTSTWPR